MNFALLVLWISCLSPNVENPIYCSQTTPDDCSGQINVDRKLNAVTKSLTHCFSNRIGKVESNNSEWDGEQSWKTDQLFNPNENVDWVHFFRRLTRKGENNTPKPQSGYGYDQQQNGDEDFPDRWKVKRKWETLKCLDGNQFWFAWTVVSWRKENFDFHYILICISKERLSKVFSTQYSQDFCC